ncbi:type VI secretion system-associated FHA domain protein TagH [Vibrio intestinalis]|uniref:type VI secretion system-associated FHA domain protein TagH n=1 Tax=Vibrio intestinalis TaxID=2933291 RepID=UPI0021A8E2F4|nr:type VI secretion system-associated FHA domain protein TagH [Vibrio intestinalis]
MPSIRLTLSIAKCPEEYTGVKNLELQESGGSIGRASSCTMPLVDHNRFISGVHCLITVYGDTYYISDVSTNGTLVNSNKILKNQPVSIVDGDVISLGQYEVIVAIEKVTVGQDIAADIAPERTSNDPLINLPKLEVKEEQVGAIDELFAETKPCDIQSNDPVDHLKFDSRREEGHLIRDEGEHEPTSSYEVPVQNSRQLSDDSYSVHSEFDLPNLIPEDWNQTATASSEPVEPSVSVPEQVSAVHQRNSRNSEHDLSHSVHGQRSTSRWEEVTQSVMDHSPTTPPPEEQPQLVENDDSDALDGVGLSKAFYEGLGVTPPNLDSNQALLFKQMGMCLRLCIARMQDELYHAECFKEDHDASQRETNIVDLMLELNRQQLLTPNELVEQMLDDLSQHNVNFNKAISELISEQFESNAPDKFAKDIKAQSFYVPNTVLWSKYLKYYSERQNGLSESALKELIKNSYQKVIKDIHA